MLVKNIQLTSFSGLAWGQKASLQLEGGPTYHELILDFLGTLTDPAKLVRWGLDLNGEEIMYGSGADLKLLEDYEGLEGEDDVYSIPFEKSVAKNEAGANVMLLVTKPSDNLLLTVELAADSDNPPLQLQATARTSARQSQRKFIPRMQKFTFAAAATGENDFLNLVRGPRIQTMHVKTTHTTGLRILRDRVEEVGKTTLRINNLLLSRFGKKPQTGYWHFDPTASGFAWRDLFPTVAAESLAFKFDMEQPETVEIMVRTVQLLAQPE